MKNQSTKLPVNNLTQLDPIIDACNNADDMISLIAFLTNALAPNSNKDLCLGELEVNGLRVILDILLGELNSISGALTGALNQLKTTKKAFN